MAKLTEDPHPMPEFSDFEDHNKYFNAQQAALNEISDPILRFPRADGYALYRVVEFEHEPPCHCCGRGGEPLLQHIPYMDAYRAAGETINGVTTKDARRRANR